MLHSVRIWQPPPGPMRSARRRLNVAPLSPTCSSNAAVSVLLGQRWRDMPTSEKASYVIAARKIKEEFVAAHPDARSRGIRKPKRKMEGGARMARTLGPPSLHALALVGSRLNQESFAREDAAESESSFVSHEQEHESSFQSQQRHPLDCNTPSLLDQLCTVAENEHTAAAQMLSALHAF